MSHVAPRGRSSSGRELRLKVTIAEGTYRDVGKVVIFFQTARSDQLQMLEMLPGRGNDFEARIPSRYMVGSKVKYYFQAEDRTGQVLATLGSRRRPYELRLEGDTLGADSFASGSSLDGSDNSFSSGRKYFGMSLGLGTGFGWVTLFAKPVTQKGASLKEAGLAIAPVHTLTQLDFWLSPAFSLGGYARVQLVEFSALGGVRVQYSFAPGAVHETRLRGGFGIGNVRHLVKLGSRLDTTLEGEYNVSLGLTYRYKLSDSMGFVVMPDYLQMFGQSPSYHLDLTLGVDFLL